MAWARVDDGWWCHPKVLALDLDARGLWISALSWSCQQKTHVIPAPVVAMCQGDSHVAGKLVDAGLWDDLGGGNYAVHDWEEYQSERAKKAAAGREGGKKSGETRRERSTDGASDEAETGASTEAGPTRPGPTRPNPSELKSETSSRKRADRAQRLPDDWRPEPEPELVKQLGGQKAAKHEWDKFVDYWKGVPGAKGRKLDWQATWRNWIRRASEGKGGKPGEDSRPPVDYDPDDAVRRFELLTGERA